MAYSTVGNVLQRELIGSEYYYRFSLGAAGFTDFYTQDQVEALIASGVVFTASNGLTKVGNDFRLGGTLLATTSIDLGGFNLLVGGTGGLQLDANVSQLSAENGSYGIAFNGGNDGKLVVFDGRGGTTGGLEEADDYSAFKGPLNVVTKLMLDASTSGNFEKITFTGATGLFNIDFTINDRAIKFKNPDIRAYNVTGSVEDKIIGFAETITRAGADISSIDLGGIVGDGYILLTNN